MSLWTIPVDFEGAMTAQYRRACALLRSRSGGNYSVGARMTVIDKFSLQRNAFGGSDDSPPRASVLHEGRNTGLTIDGAILEAQYALDDSYLLLVTDDSPYEETLHVYLMNSEFEMIDSVHLGYAYTSGILRDVRIVAGNALEFTFSGSAVYRLTVHSEARHLWNAPRGPAEVLRFLGKRRLEVIREDSHAK
jgi:hypothetical protein